MLINHILHFHKMFTNLYVQKKLIEFDSYVLNVKKCYLPHVKLLGDCVIPCRYQF